jgi:hypothetical protein
VEEEEETEEIKSRMEHSQTRFDGAHRREYLIDVEMNKLEKT